MVCEVGFRFMTSELWVLLCWDVLYYGFGLCERSGSPTGVGRRMICLADPTRKDSMPCI